MSHLAVVSRQYFQPFGCEKCYQAPDRHSSHILQHQFLNKDFLYHQSLSTRSCLLQYVYPGGIAISDHMWLQSNHRSQSESGIFPSSFSSSCGISCSRIFIFGFRHTPKSLCLSSISSKFCRSKASSCDLILFHAATPMHQAIGSNSFITSTTSSPSGLWRRNGSFRHS